MLNIFFVIDCCVNKLEGYLLIILAPVSDEENIF
jgi:hypothetical protein